MNYILPLFPKNCNKPGHRLLLKCDSGPGRLQIELLAKLRYLGVYLYPCVPNTTAVTQETYRTYGRFKSQYRANLELIVDELVKQDKSVSVPQYKHGLLVFEGVDPNTVWSSHRHSSWDSLVSIALTRGQRLVLRPSSVNVLMTRR